MAFGDLTLKEMKTLLEQHVAELRKAADGCLAINKLNEELWKSGGAPTNAIVDYLSPMYADVEAQVNAIAGRLSSFEPDIPGEVYVNNSILGHYATITASTGVIAFKTRGGLAAGLNDADGMGGLILNNSDEIQIARAEDHENIGGYLLAASGNSTTQITIHASYIGDLVDNTYDTKLYIIKRFG